jgi:hypothetical protein
MLSIIGDVSPGKNSSILLVYQLMMIGLYYNSRVFALTSEGVRGIQKVPSGSYSRAKKYQP